MAVVGFVVKGQRMCLYSTSFETLKMCLAQQYFDKKQLVIVITKSYVLLLANQRVDKTS